MKNILNTIGNTPMVRLNKINQDINAAIWVKLEFFNPGGSVKDRIGITMIEDAERKGLLKPGGTIVEPTSGNTGIGLALVAVLKGYKMIFTMPDKMSKEKESLLRAYGAKVIRTPTAVLPEDPRSYYKVAEKITKETKNAFCPNQYYNQNNPKTHYETTGPEIWRDTNGMITHFVAGMGTGGTISGAGKYLKNKNPNIKIIGADPEGSIFHHEFYKTKGKIHTYKTEGIGEDFIPDTINLEIVDEIITVNDKNAFLTTRRLAKEEGLLVGGSSGAAAFAALKIAKNLDKNDVIVVLFPDTGRNYLSTIFNDEWMLKNDFL
ncbi:MAG: cysteine synthase A [Patescibacteria group bacterium]|nr:cysteine synthase A [Patescibacteria group bacterium]